MNNDKIDLEYLDIEQLAREFWQDDLAKFFLKQNEPTYSEYRMYRAGFEKALELQEVEKDEEMFLNEHDENVRLHFENVELKEQNARLREALEVLKRSLKETKEQLKETVSFIESMETLTK